MFSYRLTRVALPLCVMIPSVGVALCDAPKKVRIWIFYC